MSGFKTVNFDVPQLVRDQLAAGSLGANDQLTLLQRINAHEKNLSELPLVTGLVSPSHGPTGDQMQGVVNSAALTLSVNDKLQILPCTRAMKTHAKNLLGKLARLRARLVSFGDCGSLEKQKKYFQFRLVGIEDIDVKEKKTLDEKVGKLVIDTLVTDVTAQLTLVENEQKTFGERLQTELDDLAAAAMVLFPENIFDLTDEQKRVKELWKNTITYNIRWFGNALVNLQAGLESKVNNPAWPIVFRNKIKEHEIEMITNFYIVLSKHCLDETNDPETVDGSRRGGRPSQTSQTQQQSSSKSSRRRQNKKERQQQKKVPRKGRNPNDRPKAEKQIRRTQV